MAEAASPSSHSSFCEEVFSFRIRGTNEVNRTNILAPGLAFFLPSLPNFFGNWPNWEVVSRYSSATAPDSHAISCADPLFQARKELESRTSDLRSASQDLSNQPTDPILWPHPILLLT